MQNENTPAAADRHHVDLEVDVKVTIIVATRDDEMIQVSRTGRDAGSVLDEAVGDVRRVLGSSERDSGASEET